MPTRSSKKLDPSQLAKSIVDQTTGEAPKTKLATPKQRAGSKGGTVGGKSRMQFLTPDQKRDLSMLGVAARKAATAPQAVAAKESKK